MLKSGLGYSRPAGSEAANAYTDATPRLVRGEWAQALGTCRFGACRVHPLDRRHASNSYVLKKKKKERNGGERGLL
jgi:hypothetical protein